MAMFSLPGLLWRRSAVANAVSRPLGAGERIYAIGDIHGRSDLLDDLWTRIREDLRAHPIASAELVYLGDYVDRGPDSFGVLERLCAPAPDLPPATALRGNHDLVLHDFLEGQDVGALWRDFGGLETLRSYGAVPEPVPGRRWFDVARGSLLGLMPQNHRALLTRLQSCLDRPPYFFCHAGVRPGVPVEKQDVQDLMWIRDEFLRSDVDFGRVVVHGHTPVSSPDIRRNRIGIDTGAYASGVLTCAALEIDDVHILQTIAP